MATDPQSLYDQAKCLDCFSAPGLLQLAQVGAESIVVQSVVDSGGIPGPSGAVTVPTGLTLSESPGLITANWDALPAGVDGTQVQTSSVGTSGPWSKTFNFVASPGTSVSFTAPAVGDQLCARIRFRKNGLYSAWTVGVCHTYLGTMPEALDWAARVVANGGAIPSQNSIDAASAFVAALKTANIWTKILGLNMIAPDSLIAAITPLVKGTGNDPWTNNNFVAGDLSVNGLKGRKAAPTFLNTGLRPDNIGWPANSYTIAILVTQDASLGTNEFQIGASDTPYTHAFDIGFLSGVQADLTFNPGGRFGGGTKTNAYFCVTRTNATTAVMYFARTGTAHGQVGGGAAGTEVDSRAFVPFPFYLGAVNVGNVTTTPSNNRWSLAVLATSFTAADSLALFNAAQALRNAFGGGSV